MATFTQLVSGNWRVPGAPQDQLCGRDVSTAQGRRRMGARNGAQHRPQRIIQATRGAEGSHVWRSDRPARRRHARGWEAPSPVKSCCDGVAQGYAWQCEDSRAQSKTCTSTICVTRERAVCSRQDFQSERWHWSPATKIGGSSSVIPILRLPAMGSSLCDRREAIQEQIQGNPHLMRRFGSRRGKLTKLR
ncbi:hypothetical protein ACVWVY_006880 [Bradyrhizobium sp. URHC0002]